MRTRRKNPFVARSMSHVNPGSWHARDLNQEPGRMETVSWRFKSAQQLADRGSNLVAEERDDDGAVATRASTSNTRDSRMRSLLFFRRSRQVRWWPCVRELGCGAHRLHLALAPDETQLARDPPSAAAACATAPAPLLRIRANASIIFDFSAENAEIVDCLAEQGGFETPVSREVALAEKCAGIGDILAPRSGCTLVENEFATHSAKFRS